MGNSDPDLPAALAELQAAIEDVMNGVRDPEKMRIACEEMDRMREETYRKHGLLDIGVPAIRELRGPLPDEPDVEADDE